MTALKKYSKYLKKALAYDAMCKDMKDQVMRELKRQPEGQAVCDGVEYHLTTKTVRTYNDPKLKEMKAQVEALEKQLLEAGAVKIKENETFDAYIPKSSKETVLARAVPDYKKHFSVAA